MAEKGGKFERYIQKTFLRPLRLKEVAKIINHLPYGSVLDLGCMDDYLLNKIDKEFDYTGIDDEPLCRNPRIRRTKVENIKGKKYDIVIATEVLEHLDDPAEAIRKMKSLSRRYILISVPNEPFFSLFRLGLPAREHLWTIFPWVLKKYLGRPLIEKKVCFRRTYMALWDIKKKSSTK